MKVNISVAGRFHAFDLAAELKRYNVLNKLITTYPKFKVREWGLENKEIISLSIFEVLNRYKHIIPFIPEELINKMVQKNVAKKSAKHLFECDVHIGWSGGSLETLIEAKKLGKMFILERGSSHYSYQMNILQEEYESYGMEFKPNYYIWQRELLEYELADYISVPSSFVKKTFMKYGFNEKKLIVNPYGVNLYRFKQLTKKDDVFRIIFAGNGSIRKGYHYLLRAFYELNLPDAEVWHLGRISDEVKPFLKKYKTDRWILKGHISQNELYKFYSQGNVFVLPSLEEGFGMVLFQAMACGLPLICTSNTGGEELVTENGEEGFVIPVKDVEVLKEKIFYLYKNRDICFEMGQKAKNRVKEGFTWHDYGRRYYENLKRIYDKK